MIKANISFSDLEYHPKWTGDVINMGRSRIIPYNHSALEAFLVRTTARWFMVVRERSASSVWSSVSATGIVDDERFNGLYRDAILWPLDYLMIEGAQDGRRIKLRAGLLGSAPIYYRVTDEDISISYDFADFFCQKHPIDLGVASRRLGLIADYSATQILSGVLMLTERALVYAEPGKTRYQYPCPAKEISPAEGELEDHGVATFEELLNQAVSVRPARTPQIAVELSGGMDSAAVACGLGHSHKGIASLGILLDDKHSDAQAGRRRMLVEQLDMHDEAVNIEDFPPTLNLQPSLIRKDYPLPEFYLEAFEGLWDIARRQGRELLFTGLGGDQLFPVYRNELQPTSGESEAVVQEAKRRAEMLLTPRALNASRSLNGMNAPATHLSASVLASCVCQAPYLLRRGLWPINPLSDPYLAYFCYRLPLGSRKDREAMWQYLQSRLGPGVFPRNYAKETFAQVLPNLIAQQAKTIESQLRECALSDLGLVDRGAVLRLLDDLVTTRARALTAPLASFLWLERFIRQVI